MEKKPTGLRERSKMGLAREGREEEILSLGVHQSKRTKDEENGQFPMNDLHDFPHRWGDGRRNMDTDFFSLRRRRSSHLFWLFNNLYQCAALRSIIRNSWELVLIGKVKEPPLPHRLSLPIYMQQVHVSATYSAYGRSSREGNTRTNELSQSRKEQPQLGFQQGRIQLAQHSEGSYEQTWTGIKSYQHHSLHFSIGQLAFSLNIRDRVSVWISSHPDTPPVRANPLHGCTRTIASSTPIKRL